MAKSDLLTRTEEVILTAVAGVAGHAYGMSIFEECCNLTKRLYVSIGSIYTILDRLKKKGLVESQFEDCGDSPRHNPKRCFRITDAGIQAVRETADLSRSLRLAWKNTDIPLRAPGERGLRTKKAAG